MGSWVSLTTDPKGRLIACDQGGAGLFLITPGSGGSATQVEKLPVRLSGAQGLLWAFDSLYAVVNGGPNRVFTACAIPTAMAKSTRTSSACI